MVSSCVGDNTIPMRMPIKPISIMNYIEKWGEFKWKVN
jgi:hypothetical protein